MTIPENNKTISTIHLDAIFSYATIGILITNCNGTIIAINPFALKEFGYSENELVGKKLEILIPERFHNSHKKYLSKYIEKPYTRLMNNGLDLYAVKKDGAIFPVEISLNSYENNGDKFVLSFIINTTARKKCEEEIEKMHAELEATVFQRTKEITETLKHLKIANKKREDAVNIQNAILNSAGAMIISGDKNGIIQTFNPESERELGYKASELIGKQTSLIFHDINEVRQKAKILSAELKINIPADMNVFFAKAFQGLQNEEEWTYISKYGERFPVLLTVSVLKDKSNAIVGFLGIAINISERKKAEEDLRKSLQKEKELNELKSRFVTMASHEFRSPLSTILSSAYLIERYAGTNDQPKREKHLQRIYSSVNMLTDILNDFLSVGKIEEGKIQVRLTHFNIRELVATILGEMKNSLKKKQKILFQHEGNPDVLLDVSLLKHIVMNLISNASKFSPEASIIEINTSCHDNQILLSVKDHGIGISMEDQKHLMERFFRGANAGNIEGTGLGLHLISKYTELLNGSVQFKSELEKGTEFIITFKPTQTYDL